MVATMLEDQEVDLNLGILQTKINDGPSLAEILKGRKVRSDNGYFYVSYPKHPNATKSGRIHLHRHIAAVVRGRWLEGDEIVVFLDGDKTNLTASNLAITTRRERGEALNHLPEGGDAKELICAYCGDPFEVQASHAERRKTCSPTCSALLRRKFDPDPAELERLVWEMPTTKVAELFDVSDKAVAKRCKLYGIEKPPRGYWARVYAGHVPEKHNSLSTEK